MFFMFSYSQYNLISNYTIESVNNFAIVGESGTLAFDNTIDHTENSGGSLKFTNQAADGLDNFKADQISATEMAKSGAGLYLLKFYVRGPQNARVKAAISNGNGVFNWAEFSTNLANSDSNITRIKTADTWQEVSSYMTLVEDWATVKLYNTSLGANTEIHYDDISLTKVNSPKELVDNNSFNSDVSGSGWELGTTTFVGEYTTDVDHTNLIGSGSFKLVHDDAGSTSDHIKFSATNPSNYGGAGTYVLTFWVYSTQGEWIKAQVSHSAADGTQSSTQCQFSESLVGGNPEMTRVAQNNIWQKVTSTFTMPDSGYATVRLYSVKSTSGSNIDTYFDDISLHRVVSSEQASTDFTGWEAVNATSSINSTIHSLNMDNGNPTLTNFDKYIDTSITKYIKVSLKNNSENDGLSFIYTRWDGSLKYLTIPIDPGSTNSNYQEYTFDLSDDLEFVGNIENFSLRVRKSKSSGGYGVVTETGSVDFQTITYSPTASIKDIDAKSFYIYPNPASKIIYVESEIDNEIISIYDLTGRKLIQSKAKFIDISQLSNGVYILELDKGVQKFIKK